ncbi:MAG: universal stress protein [Nitrospinae bacterium]|nr:universal stress protein [Nitrospinota bacterium]
MYKNILVMVDNSRYSDWAVDLSADLASVFGAKVTGNHVYAARLHENRFIQMEPGLPEQFQNPDELVRQRQIHSTLIEKGLKVVSDSFLDILGKKCEERKVPCERKTMEGKNYHEIVKDVENSGYDLVAMGAKGIGETTSTQLGSVCERVTRRIQVDAVVMKNDRPLRGGRVVAGIDGSGWSFAAMSTAISMAKHLGCRITALTVYDPHFHYRAFKSIAGALSEEARQVFRFEEQEKLHEEIIDSGLEKIYRNHLETALKMAADEGVEAEGIVLAGKPYDEILKWLGGKDIAMLILGKLGVHSTDGLDIGSNAETLLRGAPCNVTLVSRAVTPRPKDEPRSDPVEWENEAVEMLGRAPGFVRNMIRAHMEAEARRAGARVITAEMMKQARARLEPGR